MKQYISDLITEQEISTWGKGERILISSSTGTGKTQFILGKFYEYCKKNNLKVLFLMNRLFLKAQVENFLPADFDKKVLNIKTYQNFEAKSVNYDYISDILFTDYDVIILDEVHYLLEDSSFSKKTDVVLKYILKPIPDKILIFMSATPFGLTETKVLKETKKYTIKTNYYENINKLYFYNNTELPRIIIENIPDNEKILFFGAAKTGYDLFLKFPNSSFICATTNKTHGELSSEEELNSIVEKEKFQRRILFTTRVMVNGVTIKDENLKHIIVDDSLDVISLIQMIGRKRILSETDGFNLYIRNHHSNAIKGKIRNLEEELEQVEKYIQLGYEEFKKQHKKEDVNEIFDSDSELNIARKISKEFELSKLKIMVDSSKAGSYAVFVGRVLGVPESDKEERWNKYMFNADKIFKSPKAIEILDRYHGKKLFKNEQTIFKNEFLDTLLHSETDKKSFGLNTLQGILLDNNMPFVINSVRETKGEMIYKRYWIVKKII